MRRLALAVAVLRTLAAGRAEAGLVITFDQVGSAVVATGSGSLITAGLTDEGFVTATQGATPSNPSVIIGPAQGSAELYDGYFSSPPAFGTGTNTFVTSGTGAIAGFFGNTNHLIVPTGYASNAALASSSTFAGATLGSLCLTPGTYVYSYSAAQGGPALDSITVRVDPAAAATPEPATLGTLALAAIGSGLYGWRRSRRRRAA